MTILAIVAVILLMLALGVLASAGGVPA